MSCENGESIRVLIVVPDSTTGQAIAASLDRAPYEARVERCAAEAMQAIRGWRPDVVMMHVGMGTARVIGELSEVRAFDGLPIIGVIQRHELATEVAALDAGIDDILAHPLIGAEVRAHLRAVLRRRYGPYHTVSALRVGVLEIDLVERCLRVGNKRIHLTSLEQALLYLLATDAGNVVSRDTIIDALWDTDAGPENNALDRHVSRLRAKLRPDLPPSYRIETVRGQGYRLMPANSVV